MQHRYFGQPAAQTHPHLVSNGHVTPGITAEEYRMRRQKLMEAIAKNSKTKQDGGFLVIVPSSPKTYMTYDIPYPFRQNTEFFYLCGFLEPDSVLILEAKSMADLPNHNALLFVPKRDPLRERWDGPRSGIDGAMLLTGVDAAFNNNDLGCHLDSYISKTNLKSIWYDSEKPSHIDFHNQYFNRFLAGCRNKAVESPQMIMQSLRIIKSPAEIELMKQTCRVASESMCEVMKFSRPQVDFL
jgi:Xaa-Pro aminopeptidase